MKNFVLPLILILGLVSLTFGQDGQQGAMGENDFSVEEEQANSYLTFDENSYSDTLSAVVDISYKLPVAGNQGSMGSCWAWATTYAYRSYLEFGEDQGSFVNNNNFPNFSKIFSPMYTYHYYKGIQNNCNYGNSSYKILKKILTDGSIFYNKMPYRDNECSKNITREHREEARKMALTGYEVVMIKDVFTMKKILNDGIPLILSIRIDNMLWNIGNSWDSTLDDIPLWNVFDKRRGSHAMVITGYNDDHKAFKVLNSWGKDWGDNGYVWIGYNIIESSMNYSCYARKKRDKSILEGQAMAAVRNSPKDNNALKTESSLSSWVKKKYYRPFNDLRIGLIQFKPKKEFGIINITSDSGEKIKEAYLEKGETMSFYYAGNEYQIKFDNIGGAGVNPLNKAMYFTIKEVKFANIDH